VGALVIGREADSIVFDGAGELIWILDFEVYRKFGFGMIRREGMDENILDQGLD
jgi:hypothetical protein